MEYKPSKKFSLKKSQKIDEKWLQYKITEHPEILGLGENIEHIQPSGVED